MWRVVLLVAVLFFSNGCAVNPQQREEVTRENPRGWILLFQETRPFEPQSQVRMMITDRYLRIDYGQNELGFVLLDRQERVIHNVLPEDQSVLTVGQKFPLGVNAPDYRLTVETAPSHVLTRTATQEDVNALHAKYFVDGIECHNVVAVPDMLPEALSALREYRSVLAGELTKSVNALAAGDADGLCDAVINVFEPELIFTQGFPLREWNKQGYQRFLIDYRWDVELRNEYFEVPPDYYRVSTDI